MQATSPDRRRSTISHESRHLILSKFCSHRSDPGKKSLSTRPWKRCGRSQWISRKSRSSILEWSRSIFFLARASANRTCRINVIWQVRDEIELAAAGRTRALLLGGIPFEEPILMWWNFVGRTREEFELAYQDWIENGDRFGDVRSGLPRVTGSPPQWSHRPSA